MKIFLIILFSICVVTVITYSSLALRYRRKVRSEARMNFDDFRFMYKIAPEKWEYNKYWKVLYYYPDGSAGFKCSNVYMNTYFDNLKLILFWMKKEREKDREVAHKKALEIIESLEKDVAEKRNEYLNS